ncbi:MAG TPA: response regulator [Candidatus Limnocylindrales bacterium]
MPSTARSFGRSTASTVPPTILVIDDDDYVLGALRAALRGLRATVVRGSTAAEGLELARDLRPALAIVDLGLPDRDGYEVTRSLRRQPGLESMRIVILTGYLPDESAAHEAGADLIIGKPFRVHEFLEAVYGQLEARETT